MARRYAVAIIGGPSLGLGAESFRFGRASDALPLLFPVAGDVLVYGGTIAPV